NSSTLSCVAGLPPPYSVSRGPIRLKTISMLPAWLAIPSMYVSTAAASSASITAACDVPPSAVICIATSSTLDPDRPETKTSAPSPANSLATTEPNDPPAPNRTACLPFNICALFIGPLLRFLLILHGARPELAPFGATTSRDKRTLSGQRGCCLTAFG